MEKLQKAFDLFDACNQQDPASLIAGGVTYPAAYFYALQLYRWVKKLEPNAGEALLLASRCQHICRWEIPRETYPQGKAGYLKWRKDLAEFHAGKAASLLREVGYNEVTISRVMQIVRKQDIKKNPDSQTMENALCLVFLEFQYNDFITPYDDSKVMGILRKTWAKMSEPGRKAALSLAYSGRAAELLEKAIAEKHI